MKSAQPFSLQQSAYMEKRASATFTVQCRRAPEKPQFFSCRFCELFAAVAVQTEPPKSDAEQEDYALVLKHLLRTAVKHIQQLQQPTEPDYEGPYLPDSLPLSALEQLFALTWESCEVTPELSMQQIVQEVATELGADSSELLVRCLHWLLRTYSTVLYCTFAALQLLHGYFDVYSQLRTI
jgi:hypothetical protein